ncbi:hypothetical protein M378DRAFT_159180 [Amanita muscaria Koide BX008]|uniref:Uncharacterized protein n=1 Tax=Amanita muscaria (strain Koide BX008) TaxID=946122 RepID=A0A0C2TLE8_AMAMK|nr:hypothetical protein M378DRAFT_159180 [Amanita muscaria Koide BX008]
MGTLCPDLRLALPSPSFHLLSSTDNLYHRTDLTYARHYQGKADAGDTAHSFPGKVNGHLVLPLSWAPGLSTKSTLNPTV